MSTQEDNMKLNEALEMIRGLDTKAMDYVQERLDSLTKPLGSLGVLEEIVKQLAGISGNTYPVVDRKTVIIMCSDNGVVDEGVSQAPKSVTSSITRNFTRGITGVGVLSAHAGAEIVVVDIGVDDDLNYEEGIINRKIRKGTWNIAQGPAMTREEALKAIETGIEMVLEQKNRGVNLLATGEMGIGNTTTSSAVAAVLTGTTPDAVVGRGAGLTSEGVNNKVRVVQKAIECNKPDPADAVDVLAKVGGFDIAGLAGCFIGAAACRLPILIDGFISSAAALAAVKIKPEARNFIFPSHSSAEPGSKRLMEALGLEPMLNLRMRLGEGTGAALAFHIMDAAVAAYTRMGTFADVQIDQYVPLK
jgi:nicotinate-nucleotide--dimethylbenzimidazole phosphoribosyltransferase